MNTTQIIAKRYLIIKILGQGGSGITYQARDLQTDEYVAVKELSLTKLDDWKKLELFEREVKILKQLEHRGIPKYLDYFQIDEISNRYFYLVQELAPGKSLAELIEERWNPSEETVKFIATQLLDILTYLQEQIPPIIHRDIKPQNIIYNLSNNSLKREIFLVDFGGVQETYRNTVTGNTFVGTYGYMAPEQFRGKSTLSTDLYGLGTTLLFLLTRQSPTELPQKNLKINFHNSVSISSHFYNWIELLIEPNINNRFTSAKEALAGLNSRDILNQKQKLLPPKNLSNILLIILISVWRVWLVIMLYGAFELFGLIYPVLVTLEMFIVNRFLKVIFIVLEIIYVILLLLYGLLLWVVSDTHPASYEVAASFTCLLVAIDFFLFKIIPGVYWMFQKWAKSK